MEKEIFVKIEGVDYKVRQSYRALMLFETITGRSVYNINETLSDIMTLFYAILQANNRDTFKFSYDEFVDLIDRNQESIETFNTYLLESADTTPAEEPQSKKKKPQSK